MAQRTRKLIAIDIDDVVADTTEAVRAWVNNKFDLKLERTDYYVTDSDYWNYFDKIWQKHGIHGQVNLHDIYREYENDQSHVSPISGVQQTIGHLRQVHDIVFITARPPSQGKETRRWLDMHIDAQIPVYFSANPFFNQIAQSKGEICAELGVDILIDDSIDNCRNAMQHGIDALLFGSYGWNAEPPDDLRRCDNWQEVLGFFDERF